MAKVPTITDHDGSTITGYPGEVIKRHPCARGAMTAPMELILYKDGDQYIVHRYNMQDKGRYGGGYHRTGADALEDFNSRVLQEIEYHNRGVEWTYDPELVLTPRSEKSQERVAALNEAIAYLEEDPFYDFSEEVSILEQMKKEIE